MGSQRLCCGARTRRGFRCRGRRVEGSTRCALHGGLSTGPRTAAGRAAISAAQKNRHAMDAAFADIVLAQAIADPSTRAALSRISAKALAGLEQRRAAKAAGERLTKEGRRAIRNFRLWALDHGRSVAEADAVADWLESQRGTMSRTRLQAAFDAIGLAKIAACGSDGMALANVDLAAGVLAHLGIAKRIETRTTFVSDLLIDGAVNAGLVIDTTSSKLKSKRKKAKC